MAKNADNANSGSNCRNSYEDSYENSYGRTTKKNKSSPSTKQQTATDRINPDRTVQVLTYQNKNTGTGNCI